MEVSHVLLFPFPASGHIKPFLDLAKLLCTAGLRVSFLSTDYNHARLHDRQDLEAQFPSLHFESIPDGLPPDKPRDLLDPELHASLETAAKPFRELLISFKGGSPVSCVITDVLKRFPMDVAEELGVPVMCFCTYSARYLFLYFWVPNLIRDAHLPYPEGKQEQKVNGVGAPVEVEEVLRYKDLPGFWAMEGEIKHDLLNGCLEQTLFTSRSSALILNTFDELEASFLTSLSKIYNKIYTIGPLHSLLNNNISHSTVTKEDPHSCLAWLNSRPSRSVVYVSFGSWIKLTSSQLMEFWNGLVNSGESFLLVLRSDSIEGDDGKQMVKEILETKAEGRWVIVSWAPQEEVLAHKAIGAFLTHSGWNSILESVAAGVPMISWSLVGDQSSNCMWISNVWKIGLEMEDECDRFMVETMVRSIMKKPQDEEMRKKVMDFAKRANDGVCKDGTSLCNFERLVEDIKKIKL